MPLQEGNPFSPGMIMQWIGSAASCPAGWHICDGLDGTPDLRDCFVFGAGFTYPLPGTTGGSWQHTHTVSGTGSANAALTSGNHSHTSQDSLSAPQDADDITHTGPYIVSPSATLTNNATTSTDPGIIDTGHAHTVSTTDENYNIPPFMALFFIIKL